MNNSIQTFKHAAILLAALLFVQVKADATTYTTVASGAFSSGAIWGGTAPASLTSGDQVIISNGHTVTLDQDISLTAGITMTVNGTLNGSNGYYIKVEGTLSKLIGAGSIDVDSISLVNTNLHNFEFGGTVTVGTLHSNSAIIDGTGSNIVTIENTLYVSGTLSIVGATVQLQQNADILLDDGSIAAYSGGIIMLNNAYSVKYTSTSAGFNTGKELTGAGLTDLEINIGAGNYVILQNDITVKGLLNIVSGIFVLNGKELTFGTGGDLAISANGDIMSTTGSDITIANANGLTGSIKLVTDPGGNVVDKFTINTTNSTGNVSIDGDMIINGELALQNGRLNPGTNKIELGSSATVTGGSDNSYVVAENGGRLAIELTTGNSQTYHVGTANNYAPATITAAATSGNSIFSVGFDSGVKENGNTGNLMSTNKPMVNGTWFIESSATTNVEADVELSWSAAMEVNSFDRANAYVAHYINNKWETDALSAATTSGSMYSIKRTGIKSFSQFAVFDKNTFVSVGYINNTAQLNIYPNPASDVLNITTNGKAQAGIYNLSGQLMQSNSINSGTQSINISSLPAGIYTVRLQNGDATATQNFIKQ